MLLLTDEEIEAIPITNFGDNTDDLNIAKAQLKKVKKRLKEFEGCIAGLDLEHPEYYSRQEFAVFPVKYLQALLKEIE